MFLAFQKSKYFEYIHFLQIVMDIRIQQNHFGSSHTERPQMNMRYNAIPPDEQNGSIPT